MRILVTGAGGLLGAAFVRGLDGDEVATAGRAELDVTRPAHLLALAADARADVVVNCAAHTDVDGAERDPDPAYAANALLPGLLAQGCRLAGARLVHFSSTGAYGTAEERPYTEEDPLRPTTVHHAAKAAGEAMVRAAGADALVLRTGWLFGGRDPKARNFVRARLLEAAGKERMASDATQRGNPTWVDDVVRQVRLLLEVGVAGTFNCVNAGVARRCDYVAAIVARSGRDCRVEPSAMPFARAAAVAPNEGAENRRLRLLGLDRMGPWRDALDRYLDEARGWPEWADAFAAG